MKRLSWWMRIIGAFYLLLTFMNLYGFFVQSSMFTDVIGKIYPSNDGAVHAFMDA